MTNIILTTSEAKVLAKLLKMAGAKFSQNGCNDFHLVKDAGLTPGEAQELIARLQVDHPGEEEAYDHENQYDWLLMHHFQKKLERDIKSPARVVVSEGEGVTITAVRVSPETRAGLNTGGARLPPLDHT